MSAFKQLSKNNSNYSLWQCVLPDLDRLSVASRVGRNGSKLYYGGNNAKFFVGPGQECLISPLDLLEVAASIAEFQAEHGSSSFDPIVFSRWTKRNPATTAPFEFAAEYLSDRALALRCILPLINAGFCTTDPVRAFIELLAAVWAAFKTSNSEAAWFLNQPEPCRWTDFFKQKLDRLKYEADDDSDALISGGPYHRVKLDTWVNGKAVMPSVGWVIHPFLGPNAREWHREQSCRPELEWVMDQPAYISKDVFIKCRDSFGPPLTVYRVNFQDGDARVLLAGSHDGCKFTSFGPTDAAEWRGFVVDFLTMYGAVRRASGAHFERDQRTCHHSGCSQYDPNFCNAYTIIPKDYSTCGFPERIKKLIALMEK